MLLPYVDEEADAVLRHGADQLERLFVVGAGRVTAPSNKCLHRETQRDTERYRETQRDHHLGRVV